MTSLFDAIAYGLVAGSIYALVAIGYSLVYSVLGFINFAHGELLAIGAYLCWALGVGVFNLPLPLSVFFAVLMTGALSFALGRYLLIPARRRSAMAALVVAIGVSLALQNLIGLTFSPDAKPFWPGLGAQSVATWLPLKPIHVFTLVGTIGLLGFVWFFFLKRTSVGIEIRACASNSSAAYTMGLRRARVFGLIFFISGILAALAGIAKGLDDQIIVPTFGFALGLRAFIASVVGGVTNVTWAIAGAFVLGMVENLALFALFRIHAFAPLAVAVSKDAIALILLVAILIWRPRGLFSVRFEPRP